ncbi:hypothetical protein [Lactococcus sp. NH2-7C]|uniref:hypothetical protein n=1 Tax=Lactococcus sp. NH2-7C TaxID=2879149 RepID=UPI001CDB79AD|nr:hypothetical protein [Lactococcus sp. NH2-7C]MCA2391277.1 hypothetical protein [Lactococcus sp. NH2-7C]WGV29293.1 hypothetical protein QJV49_06895 [Lactococcus sp. NH2-7C]
MTELEKQREAWERLENNLKKVLSIPWEEFDSPDSGKIPRELDKVHVLHRDIYKYPIIVSKNPDVQNGRMKHPSLYLNNGLTALAIGYGEVISKKVQGSPEEDSERKEATIKDESAPRFVSAILDYLHGTIAFQDGELFVINSHQLIKLSNTALGKRYKTSKKSLFQADDVMSILKFIHSKLDIQPVKTIKTTVIAGTDFQIDFKQRKLSKDTLPKNDECYFKYFEGQNYESVAALTVTYAQFLSEVTDDSDSLHNASLQPAYQMLVACGLMKKDKFFVSKSRERTGKGLRNGIISSLFDTKTVNLNELSNKATGAMAWANLDAKEMYLATESAGLDRQLEVMLKIIATETVAQGRKQGRDYSEVDLSGILSIDTNEKVFFSSGMKSRAVNIAFKDRPVDETDEERKAWFDPYAKPLTENKISGGLSALLHSFLFWKSQAFRFNFKQVEMNNFTGDDAQFDDVQIYVMDKMIAGDDVVLITNNDELKQLFKETYTGSSRQIDRKNALDEIGTAERKSQVIHPLNPGRKSIRHIRKINPKRFQKASTAYMEQIMEDAKFINDP